jgi:hypothetical protein
MHGTLTLKHESLFLNYAWMLFFVFWNRILVRSSTVQQMLVWWSSVASQPEESCWLRYLTVVRSRAHRGRRRKEIFLVEIFRKALSAYNPHPHVTAKKVKLGASLFCLVIWVDFSKKTNYSYTIKTGTRFHSISIPVIQILLKKIDDWEKKLECCVDLHYMINFIYSSFVLKVTTWFYRNENVITFTSDSMNKAPSFYVLFVWLRITLNI